MPTTMSFSENLDVYFSDFSVALTWDGDDYPCLFSNKYDELSFQSGGRLIKAVVKSADFAGLTQGEIVTIEGTDYSVANLRPLQDGKILELILEE